MGNRTGNRPETEIIREALAGYLAADRHYVDVLRQRIESADRGEFASEEEVATQATMRQSGRLN